LFAKIYFVLLVMSYSSIFCHLRSTFLATFLFLFLEFWISNAWTLNKLPFLSIIICLLFWMYFYSLLSFQCFNPLAVLWSDHSYILYLHLNSNNRIRHPTIVKEKPSRSLLSRLEFIEWLSAVAFFTSCKPSKYFRIQLISIFCWSLMKGIWILRV